MNLPTLDHILKHVLREVDLAMEADEPFHSAHEGFAILKEEVDELWDEVKKKHKNRDYKAMRAEAVQIAAMAIRFAVEVTQ